MISTLQIVQGTTGVQKTDQEAPRKLLLPSIPQSIFYRVNMSYHLYQQAQAQGSQSSKSAVHVFFDLETTGLNTPAITQIAAVGPSDMGEFNRFVIPTKPIDPGASAVTGLTYTDGLLHKDGVPVDAIPVSQALMEFVNFIGNQKVVLVAHNAHWFDGPILRRVAESVGLQVHLQNKIVGVMDTLKIFREIHPSGSNKLESLMQIYLGRGGQTHGALDDARDLQSVVMHAQPSLQLQMKYTESL